MSNPDEIVCDGKCALFCPVLMRNVHLKFGLPCGQRTLDGLLEQNIDLDWPEL